LVGGTQAAAPAWAIGAGYCIAGTEGLFGAEMRRGDSDLKKMFTEIKQYSLEIRRSKKIGIWK